MKKQLLSCFLLATVLSACPAQNNTWPDPVPEPLNTIDYSCCEAQLKALPLNYAALAEKAYQGDAAALQELLAASADMDLPSSYVHGTVLASILKQVKDQPFADAMMALDSKLNAPHALFQESLRDSLRNMLEGGFQFQAGQESLTDFPATSKILAYQVK